MSDSSLDPKWQRTRALARGVVRFLTWVRVLDAHDGNISLTSTALLATTSAVVLNPSPIGLAAMIASLLLYGHKRHVNSSRATTDPVLRVVAKQFADVGAKLGELDKRTNETQIRLSQELNRGPKR